MRIVEGRHGHENGRKVTLDLKGNKTVMGQIDNWENSFNASFSTLALNGLNSSFQKTKSKKRNMPTK